MLIPLFCKSRLCRVKVKYVPELSVLITNCSNICTSNVSRKLFYRSSFSKMAKNFDNDKSVFEGTPDRFKGVTIHSDKEKCDINEFAKKLEDSLEFWKENGKRGIWFRVHLDQSDWVPVLTKNGFKFHHAKEEFVMMYLWLPKEEHCNIPQYAHTMIGVGAVVVNDKSQVLVVTERYSVINKPFWKLPGGYVESNEHMVDAAIREVLEETGIMTEFQSVLTFRHAHGGMFGCSDIYTVVSLKPLSEEIKKCEREIMECKWMDLDEYLNHPNVHELNRFFVKKYLEYNKHNIKINCSQGYHSVVKKTYHIYSVTKHDIEPHGDISEATTSENSKL
ncbi:hypothetical protein NQ314_010968 [Rhamnusium bicolor]|uniref:Nudix hydrolase domain-containing protein n=1 Tax=Rhamnusium bicolor TaxID=1586634 RepID=A0AAV8XNB9_9CUCU|nr:hypothetical protein NQ314_010968 [Rhamnusium bicolor]